MLKQLQSALDRGAKNQAQIEEYRAAFIVSTEEKRKIRDRLRDVENALSSWEPARIRATLTSERNRLKQGIEAEFTGHSPQTPGWTIRFAQALAALGHYKDLEAVGVAHGEKLLTEKADLEARLKKLLAEYPDLTRKQASELGLCEKPRLDQRGREIMADAPFDGDPRAPSAELSHR